jgi:Protein of unknown function (DUF3768)
VGFGHVYVTKGIAAMPPEQQSEIMRLVHGFDTFTPNNDPYGEHDFGSFEYAGKTVKSKNGEPVVNRALTIMLASKY